MIKIRIGANQLTSGFVIPLLILLLAAIGYFFLLPKNKELKESKQALAVKENEVAIRVAQLSSVKGLIADHKRKEAELAPLDEALPTAPAIPELLANIEALIGASGLVAANLQITIPPTLTKAEAGADPAQSKRLEGLLGSTENLAVLQIDLVVKGEYVNIKTFLANLEQNLRLMDILALTFTPVEKGTGAQEYALRIQTYYHKAIK